MAMAQGTCPSLNTQAVRGEINTVVTVSGCTDTDESYIRIFPRNEAGNPAIASQFIEDSGDFQTITFTIPNSRLEDDQYLSIGMGSEGRNNAFIWQINPSTNDPVLIDGVSSANTPDNANVNLINSFTGGIAGAGAGSIVGDIYDSPASLVNLVVRNLFVFAGIIIFINILIAGSKFILQGSKGMEEAKQIMTISVVGFIIMFAAYWIVQIVGIVTGTGIVPPTN